MFDWTTISRRLFLSRYAGSLGGLALAWLAAEEQRRACAAGSRASDHFLTREGRAKSVICLFQHGGPSQMDLFDPKPALEKYHGQPYPDGHVEAHFDKQKGNVLGSPYKFQKFGQCGMDLSELWRGKAVAGAACRLGS